MDLGSGQRPIIAIYGTELKEDSEKYTVYFIDIQVGPRSWTIARRFSEFAKLNRRLQLSGASGSWFAEEEELPGGQLGALVPLPPHTLFRNTGAEFVEGRRVDLERYLQSLVQVPDIWEHPAFQWFLQRRKRLSRPKRILMPLPDKDFDPTEAAVPWAQFTCAGHDVVFATQHANIPQCDPHLLHPKASDSMRAEYEARGLYNDMTRSRSFNSPTPWASVEPEFYDGVFLPGGRGPGMAAYLSCPDLRAKISSFWDLGKPVGASSSGTLAVARCTDPRTSRSVLHTRKTTTLPKHHEKYWRFLERLTGLEPKMANDTCVEDEMVSLLKEPRSQLDTGNFTLHTRGTWDNDAAAFVCRDGNYVSGRWAGDAYLLGMTFMDMIPD